jgi:hypothetical protein
MRLEQMGIILEFEGNDREILLRNLQNLNFLELILIKLNFKFLVKLFNSYQIFIIQP